MANGMDWYSSIVAVLNRSGLSLDAGLDPTLLCAQIQVESGGNEKVVSSDGMNSTGLFQITPAFSYNQMGFQNIADYQNALKTGEYNIRVALTLLSYLLRHYQSLMLSSVDSLTAMLYAWNAGQSLVDEAISQAKSNNELWNWESYVVQAIMKQYPSQPMRIMYAKQVFRWYFAFKTGEMS